jgi:potassium/hydrogen antiporter
VAGVNDPTAIMLTIGVLEGWVAAPAAWQWAVFGVQQLGGGLVMGLAVGWVGAWLLNRAHLGTAGLYPVLALGVAGLAYGTAAAVGASGFLAVYVTGLLVGARVPRHRRSIRSFHDGLANTAEIGLFLLLGMLVFPSRLPGVIVPGLVIAAILVLLARPLAVLACLVWFRYRREDLALMSWAGLRGAVPVVLATFPFTAGYPEGRFIFDMVFFVVLVSAALQGGTIGVLAGWLGLRDEGRLWAPVAEALPLDDAHTELLEVNVTDDLAVVPKGTFWHVPVEESGAELARILRRERPHVVVTYPEDGGYPHPDHIRTHDITVAALALAADPGADLGDGAGAPWRVAKVYASAGFPAERLRALHDAVEAAGIDSPFQRWLDERPGRLEGPTPTTRVRCEAWFERRDRALVAHVTQIDPKGFWFQVPRDLERATYPFEAYDLLRSEVPTSDDEDDLFAGIDVPAWDAAAGQDVAEGAATDAR